MSITGLSLGYHGCDASVADKIVSTPEHLKKSENKYDWLGSGIYFWLNSPHRALAFAQNLATNPNKTKENKIELPSVIGAVIDLGLCLDLSEYSCLLELKNAYSYLADNFKFNNKPLPQNKNLNKENDDRIIRELDCVVIQTLHVLREKSGLPAYDSVLGVFNEGRELFPGTQIMEKTHTQICIRNLDCIKGYFKVLE